MQPPQFVRLEERLKARKRELHDRLERVNLNHRRPLNQNSKERAAETENSEVVDALGNEAKEELAQVIDALHRMTVGTYGRCVDCGQGIREQRLDAYPYARQCIDCASLAERTGPRT